MTPCAVNRDPEQLGAVFPELRQNLLVQGQLISADRTPVRGIEREDDAAPPEITEVDDLIGSGME
jgi:hypothetical protein